MQSSSEETVLRVPFKLTFLSGIGGGFASGLLGLGGAFLFIPPLMRWMKLPRHQAHATSLGVMFWTALFAGALSGYRTHFNFVVIAWMDGGALLGVMLGTQLMHRVAARSLGQIFGGFLVFAALVTVLSGFLSPHAAETHRAVAPILLIGIGLLAGFLSGFLGVGSGGLVVPIFTVLLHYSQITAEAVSLAVIIPIALVGSIIHYRQHTLRAGVVFPMSLAAVLSAAGGVFVAAAIPALVLQIGFSVVLLAVGLSNMFPRSTPRVQTQFLREDAHDHHV